MIDTKMDIESAKYTSSEKDMIFAVIVIDGTSQSYCVPTGDLGNKEYAEIVKQVADGDLTIADAD